MRPISGQFVRFVLSGLLNTGITYLGFLLLQPLIGHFVAYTVVYVAGIVIAYFVNLRFVFRAAPSWRTAIRFPLVYLVQYLWGLLVMYVLVDRLQIRPAFAMIAVIGSGVPLTFLLTRYLIAGRGGDGQAPPAP